MTRGLEFASGQFIRSALRSALNAEAHLEPYQTYKMERFVKWLSTVNSFYKTFHL